MKKVVMYLMTEKGARVLGKIISLNFDSLVELNIVIGKDSKVLNDYSFEIEAMCAKANIPCYKRNEYVTEDNDFQIAIGWRWLILNPQNNLIVFHDSLLPKYRGFAPLVNSLINGETVLGVSAIFASTEYDTGRIISQKGTEISYPKLIQEAIITVSKLYEDIAEEIFKNIVSNDLLESISQDEANASYSLWRDHEDYVIDWSLDSSMIERMIDATGYPYTGAISFIDGERVVLTKSKAVTDFKIENRVPGKVIFIKDNYPVVVCGKGLLKISEMKDTHGKLYEIKKFRTRFKSE